MVLFLFKADNMSVTVHKIISSFDLLMSFILNHMFSISYFLNFIRNVNFESERVDVANVFYYFGTGICYRSTLSGCWCRFLIGILD
jgi:hypothetical protein